MQDSSAGHGPEKNDDSLSALLGGRAASIDATLPPVAFVAGWLACGRSIGWGAAAALAAAALTGGFRLARREKPRAVLLSTAFVVIAALVALHTGRAADFFLLQLLSNAASALAWTAGIALRRPFLGLIVGAVLGQRTRWRRDRALLRGYQWASWVWVGQYVLRVLVYAPLWLADATVALGAARVLLSWPLQAACLSVSWLAFRRALPEGHPGIRHPLPPDADART